MIEYRLYLLNGDNRIARSQSLTAPDDTCALQAAREFSSTGCVEVWHGTQLVARIVNAVNGDRPCA